MNYRKLRIAWSVVWGVLAVLLIALGVRSYSQYDLLAPFGHRLIVKDGLVEIGESWASLDNPGYDHSMTCFDINLPPNNEFGLPAGRSNVLVDVGTGLQLKLWSLAIVAATLAAVPWFRWRFSLRTLLIATTLIAIALGLIVFAVRR